MNDIERRAREQLAEGLRAAFPDDIARRQVIRQLLADELDYISARVAVRVLAGAEAPPEGYVLVPLEPTQDMLDAARVAPLPAVLLDSITARQNLQLRVQWQAMLAAASGAQR